MSEELHGFSDTSSYAYAAVVHLRVELESSVKSVLVEDESSEQFSQQKLSLGLFLDDKGIYCFRGRLENSALPYQAKYPVLLHSKHHLTSLIVHECHDNVKHLGVKDTLTEFRSCYWIHVPKERQVVKALHWKCTVYSKIQGKPYSAPVAPGLPEFRVENSYPFANTGVDFAGPLYLNVFGGESKMHKVYIVLYTCPSTRVVHLDLVPSLDAQSFIRSLRRFFARRGVSCLSRTMQRPSKAKMSSNWSKIKELIGSSICFWFHGGEGSLNEWPVVPKAV